MEYRRPDPCIYAHDGEDQEVGLHRMVRGHPSSNEESTPQMHEEVHQGECHRGRLLHAQETPEGPFPVILVDLCSTPDSFVCNEMHATIFTIIEAGPSRET